MEENKKEIEFTPKYRATENNLFVNEETGECIQHIRLAGGDTMVILPNGEVGFAETIVL